MEDSSLTSKVIVVIPHSSDAVPPEVDQTTITPEAKKELYIEMDVGTDFIYDFRDELQNQQIIFPWHRGIIDVNQYPKILDDCIPTKTFWDHDIYTKQPTKDERLFLLKKYHKTFHDDLSKMAEDALLIFDSHSTSKDDKDDHGDRFESDITVANIQVVSDTDDTLMETCAKELMDLYVDYIIDAFDGKYKIGTNTKYLTKTYGYIEGRYGQRKDMPYSTPVLLQEINEAMYTDEKGNFDRKAMIYLQSIFAQGLRHAVTKYFG